MPKLNPHLSRRHLSAVRMLGYSLKLGMTPQLMPDLAFVWETRMTPVERASVLAVSIACNSPVTALTLMDAAARDLLGHPLPAFGDHLEGAVFYASTGTKQENAACATACFSALPEYDRRQFLGAAKGAA